MVIKWTAFGASVRGAAHVRRGVVNQDALLFDAEHPEKPAVLAVADGLGGKKYVRSDIGAQIAVESARDAAFGNMYLRADMGDENLSDTVRHMKTQLLLRWQKAVDAHFAENDFTPNEAAVLDGMDLPNPRTAYACTLLWAIGYGDMLVLFQCGDGDILGFFGDSARELMEEDPNSFGNETLPLSALRDPAEIRHQIVMGDDLPRLITLSTDGVKNSFDDTSPENNKFYTIPPWIAAEIAQNPDPAHISALLTDQLTKITNGGSGDDVTIGVLAQTAE